jgi:glyoxylase-like metal-dependent hydrolase (beta-lactamase superfamily II)
MFAICATCGVEHAEASGTCAICADERQWVPAQGQQWTSVEELRKAGGEIAVDELEPDLLGIIAEPKVGIGQTAYLVRTPAGNLLWDPIGFLEEGAVAQLRKLGPTLAIAASHPHMFGVQVEWSRSLGGVPVLVSAADMGWVARPDPAIETWAGRRELAPGLTLIQLGGHFPGSSVVHWAAGAEGRGVLLGSDTIQTNPDRSSVTFMRSYPNRIPLSADVVERLASAVGELAFDRLYDNFGRKVDAEAAAAVQRSADRYAGWVTGRFDEFT